MLFKKITMSLVGIVLCGVSVGFLKLGAFGVDPFQTLMTGLNKLFPISFGTLYLIANAVFLLFSLFFNRKLIGIATIISMFLLGYVAQFTHDSLLTIFPSASIWIRVSSLIFGLLLICLSVSLYSTSGLGVSTYDAIAITMTDKWKLTKFKYCRIITDVICVILGVVIFLLAKGTFAEVPTFAGIGTIITAFCTGPLIEFFNVKISRPLLAEKDIGKKIETASED